MQFPFRDLTNQYISLSYQDVVQRYTPAGTSSFFLDGLGYVLFSLSNNTLGTQLLTAFDTASWAITASYALNGSGGGSSVSASWASSSISSSYAALATIAGVALVAENALTASLADTASFASAIPQDISVNSITASRISASYIETVDPTNPQQVATKGYVDSTNLQGLSLYFRSASSDVPLFNRMDTLSIPISASTTDIVTAAASSSQYIASFASQPLGFTDIKQGSISINCHAYRVGGSVSNALQTELYIYSGSTELFEFPSPSPVTLTTNINDEHFTTILVTSSLAIHPTDRLVCRVKMSNAAGLPTVHYIVEGQTNSGVTVPIPVSNFVLRSGDTMTGPLTASVNGNLYGTASNATTSSFACSSSFAKTASFTSQAGTANTASFAWYADNAGFVETASYVEGVNVDGNVVGADTASIATSASHAVIADTASYIDPTLVSTFLPFEFKFSTTTTAADPGNGSFRFNNASAPSVTDIYLSDTTNGGLDISRIISKLQSGSYQLYVQQKDDAATAVLFEVAGTPVDNTTWVDIPVSYITASGGLPGNNKLCLFGVFSQQSPTASHALTADTASFSFSASFSENAYSSIFAETASLAADAISASFALSASWAPNVSFVGMVNIPSIDTGSATPSGSIITIGTGSVHLCASPYGEPLVTHYTLDSASFAVTASFLDVQYIVATYNNGTPIYQIVTDRSLVDGATTTVVYSILMGAGGRVSYLNWDTPGILLANKDYLRVQALRGVERENGLILGVSGSTADNYITITYGRAWQGITPVDLQLVNSGVDRLVLVAHSASVWSGSLISASVYNRYDDGTNLVPLSSGDFVVNWVYRAIGNLNTTLVQLGTRYGNLPDAISSQPPTPPPELKDTAFLTGRIILKNTTNPLLRLQQVDSAYVQTFAPAGITDHNNLNNIQGGNVSERFHLSNAEYLQVSASYVTSSINSISASVALTASYLVYPSGIITATNNDTTSLISISDSIYNSMFVSYVLNDTQNFRAGNIVVLYTTSSAVLNETCTTDIGNSDGVQFSASLSASNVNLLVMNGTNQNYSVKYHYDVL